MISIAMLTLLVLASNAIKMPTLDRMVVIKEEGQEYPCTSCMPCEGPDAGQGEIVALTMTGCNRPDIQFKEGQPFNCTMMFKPSENCSSSYVLKLYEHLPNEDPILIKTETFNQTGTQGEVLTLHGSGAPTNGVTGNCTFKMTLECNGTRQLCGTNLGHYQAMTP